MMSSWAQSGRFSARVLPSVALDEGSRRRALPDDLLALFRTPKAMTAPERPTLSPASAIRFRTLVDGHFNFVWRYLRGLGVPESSVDDAAQQVFLVAARKIDSIVAGSERSFLVGTALGVAANARRAHARRHEVPDGELLVRVDDAPNPEERTEAKQGLAVLDQFLEQLPEELRVVFLLFELEGMTMAAIAESLGLPQGTVASRLRRAREEFQAMAKRFQAGMGRRPS
jgi:RNA polymerase sigma-70 factor (ECF subfamily)